jgi:hypothetical protein
MFAHCIDELEHHMGLELLVICSVLPMNMFFSCSIIHVCHQTMGHVDSQTICHDWDRPVPWFHACHEKLFAAAFYP